METAGRKLTPEKAALLVARLERYNPTELYEGWDAEKASRVRDSLAAYVRENQALPDSTTEWEGDVLLDVDAEAYL